MNYIRQLCIIMAFSFLGELLAWLLPLPVPASIYGLLLLFLALALGLVKPESVAKTGGFLISMLPVLFIAPAVRLLGLWDVVRPSLIPICIIILASTLVSFALSGKVTDQLLRRGKGGGKAHGGT